MNNSKWCCPQFRSNVTRRGERGISIAIGRRETTGLIFALEFRCVPIGEESALHITCPTTVNITASQAILYCPWCGESLFIFYDVNQKHLPLHEGVLYQAEYEDPSQPKS